MHSPIFILAVSLISWTYAKEAPRISSLIIKSDIRSRFATTLITSTILNPNPKPMEILFQVTLPNEAFISNYSMEIDQKIVVGKVKEKEEAKKDFDRAKSEGQTAGLVAQIPRETNRFQVSVNVAANEKAKFELTYQEMLKRVHDVYKHVINIAPGHTVENLEIEVLISEHRKITQLHIPKIKDKIAEKTNEKLLKIKADKDVKVTQKTKGKLHTAKIKYVPPKQKLKKLSSAQMTVLYDVERTTDGGEIQVVNGYFVHFFAPKMPVGNKNVVFILDVSTSMIGTKIAQMKAAMRLILNDLRDGDIFNIVQFSTEALLWKDMPLIANKNSKAEALKYVNSFEGSGFTNIHSALKTGLKALRRNKEDALANMLLFLTDGEPTEGVQNTDRILKDCKNWNSDPVVNIHAISFGDDADYTFIQKLAVQNGGVARKIYEASDAAIQLEGFYEEISSPLMSNVKIKYLKDTVKGGSVVKDNDDIYYGGGEVVAVGKLNSKRLAKSAKQDKDLALDGFVSGSGKQGKVKFDLHHSIPCYEICDDGPHQRRSKRHSPVLPTCLDPDVSCPPPPRPKPVKQVLPADTVGGFVERMWAYLTIKKLLQKANFDERNKTKQSQLKKKALKLSLKYNFVTELTSMVVTKPNDQKQVPLEEKAEDSSDEYDYDDYGPDYADGDDGGAYGDGDDGFDLGADKGTCRTCDMARGKWDAAKKGADAAKKAAKMAGDDTKKAAGDHTPKSKRKKQTSKGAAMAASGSMGMSGSRKSAGQKKKKPVIQKPKKTGKGMKQGKPKKDKKKVKKNKSQSGISYSTTRSARFSRKKFLNVIAKSRNDCAKQCLKTPGCLVAHFNPKAKGKKCKIGFQKGLSCSKKSIKIEPGKAVTMFCIKRAK